MSLLRASLPVLGLSLLLACAGDSQPAPASSPSAPSARPAATSTPLASEGGGQETTGSDTLVILNGTLIDGTGADPVADGHVVVAGDRILEVGSGEPQIPAGATVIDAQGGAILPGLIDAHAHITRALVTGADLRVDQEGLVAWLQDGVTTLRDVATAPIIFPSVRFFVDSLTRQGQAPRVVWAGPMVTAVGGYPTTVPRFAVVAREVASAEEARQLVEQLADGGARIIKLGLERGFFSDEGWPLLSLEEVQAITEAAHGRGLRVTAHVTSLDEVRLALDGGVDDLAHTPLEPLPDELIQEMVEKGMAMATTASIWGPGFSEEAAANAKRYLDAGGTVALATDFGCCDQAPGMESMLEEMEFLQMAGFTPLELIVAATRDGAIVSNLGHELGTIERGKLADIIVVDGDPRLDIRALANVSVVIQAGKLARDGR